MGRLTLMRNELPSFLSADGFIVQLPINYLNVGGDGSGSVNQRDSSNVFSIGHWSLSNVTAGISLLRTGPVPR